HPRAKAQLLRPGEPSHDADLGHEYRREYRSNAGDGLDGLVAVVLFEPAGESFTHHVDLEGERVDQTAQRADPSPIRCIQTELLEGPDALDAEQVWHRYLPALLAQHGVYLRLEA